MAKYKRKKKKYSALKRRHSKFQKQVCKLAFKHSVSTMDHNTLKANHNHGIHESDTLRNLQQEYFDQASQQHAWQEKYSLLEAEGNRLKGDCDQLRAQCDTLQDQRKESEKQHRELESQKSNAGSWKANAGS
jgi:chromosome segregation ATPase